MAEITVTRTDVERILSRFRVTVTEGGSSSTHDVTLSGTDFERFGSGYRSPDEFIETCFGFLLEREPKESILSSFDVSVIQSYFPEFETAVARRG